MKLITINSPNQWQKLNTEINLKKRDELALNYYSFFNQTMHITNKNNKLHVVTWLPNPGELSTLYEIKSEIKQGFYTVLNQEEENDIIQTLVNLLNDNFTDKETFKLEYDKILQRGIITSKHRFIFKNCDDAINPEFLGFGGYPSPMVYENTEGLYTLYTPKIPIIETHRFLYIEVETDGGNIQSNFINNDIKAHYMITIDKNKSELITIDNKTNIQTINFNDEFSFSKIKINIKDTQGNLYPLNDLFLILQIIRKET